MIGKTCVSLRKISDTAVANIRPLNIHVDVGQSCNFQCEYCAQGSHDNSKFEQECAQNIKVLEAFNKRLKHYISDATNGLMNPSFTFVGGEPSLYPIKKYLEILRKTTIPNDVSIITNLSADLSFYEELSDIVDILHITASYHPQYPLEQFKQKCLDVNHILKRSPRSGLTLQFTVTGTNTEEYQNLKKFSQENGFAFNPSLVRRGIPRKAIDIPKGIDIMNFAQFIGTFSDGTQERLPKLNNMPDFPLRGMICSIARDSLYIRSNGDILHNLGCLSPQNKVGNLFEGEEDFTFTGNPIVCENDYCYCYNPKWLRKETW